MRERFTLSLLEFLAYQAGCLYLSDLRYINAWQRQHLARRLKVIPAEAVSVQEWNDALNYLSLAPPAQTAQEARSRLITGLDRSLPQTLGATTKRKEVT